MFDKIIARALEMRWIAQTFETATTVRRAGSATDPQTGSRSTKRKTRETQTVARRPR